MSDGTDDKPSAPASIGAAELRAVENLTVLAATAAERPSFGCDAGLQRTYFGGAVNKALEHSLDKGTRPDGVDWAAIFERVSFAIETMEHVDGQRPSKPGLLRTEAQPPDHSRFK